MERDIDREGEATRDILDSAETAPATGTADQALTELAPGEEPVTTGTLFLTMIILMIIGAVWVIVYGMLLDR